MNPRVCDSLLQEVEAKIKEIESDPRHSYPPALVETNAPLALIQVSMNSELRTLYWVRKQMRQ